MKKVIVTGGLGFIGSNLIELLIKDGFKVINIDKITYSSNFYNVKEFKNIKNYKFIKCDISDKKLKKIIFEHKPTCIFNLAAETHVDRSIDNPENFIQSNIVGVYKLLEIFKNYSRKNNCRLIHISTDEVYGDIKKGLRSDENHRYEPSSPYAASKASADHLVKSYIRTYKLKAVISNCCNNYGPYQFPEKLIPHVILNALHGKPLPIYGNGLQVRDWLFVDDHVKALLRVVNEGIIGETYNIGGHNEKSNIEVVEMICEILEKFAPDKPHGISSYRELIEFVKDRPGHDARYAIDASKIQRDLGWIPEEIFETGLLKTVQWYLDNRQWWERVLSGAYRLEQIGDKK